jgi:hypothetical protein
MEESAQSRARLSNRPVDDWGKLLGDTAAVTALLDRLLHHAAVLKCGPRSWRTKVLTDLRAEEPRSKTPHGLVRHGDAALTCRLMAGFELRIEEHEKEKARNASNHR